MKSYLSKHRVSGFTLTEMMVVVVIIAILAAIALPSYQSYVEKTNLSEAKTEITKIYQRIQDEKLTNPQNLTSEDKVRAFMKDRIDLIPKKFTDKYEYSFVVNSEGKIFNVDIQAFPVSERLASSKFYVWVNGSGNASKCTISGNKPVTGDHCDPF